jgi:hypothetical protein
MRLNIYKLILYFLDFLYIYHVCMYVCIYQSEQGFQFAFISDIHTRYLTDGKAIKSIALFGNLKGIT